VAIFSHTVEVTTDNYAAYLHLGNLLEKAGQKDKALWLYTETVRIQPDFPLGQFDLGILLLETGHPQEASNHLAIAAQLMPYNPEVQYDLGLFLQQRGQVTEAINRFKKAIDNKPDFPAALNQLAWILATDPDPKLRSGSEAVRLAKQACELTQNQQAAFLTTLSAACAENGQFPDAMAAAGQALNLARATGQKNIADQNGELLKLYQTGKPYRESR
jgi:tetratricopeptide (TPR) repeat protein